MNREPGTEVASPVSRPASLTDKLNSLLKYVLTNRMFLVLSVVILVVVVLLGCFVGLLQGWSEWDRWDQLITLATLAVSSLVFLGESLENWERQLPRRLSVYFLHDGKVRMACQQAYLAGEGDIRAWGQQIGAQIANSTLKFPPFIEVHRLGVETSANGLIFVHFEACFTLRELPKALEDELRSEEGKALPLGAPAQDLCKILLNRGPGADPSGDFAFVPSRDYLPRRLGDKTAAR